MESTGAALTALSTDLLLLVLSFLDASSLCRIAQTDKLLCVLSAEQQRLPAFTAVHGPCNARLGAMARERLPGTPNVGFLFSTTSVSSAALTAALRRMPPGLKLIGARSRFPLLGKDVSARGVRFVANHPPRHGVLTWPIRLSAPPFAPPPHRTTSCKARGWLRTPAC